LNAVGHCGYITNTSAAGPNDGDSLMRFSFPQKFGAALLVTAWLIWGSNVVGDLVIPASETPRASAATTTAAAPAAASAKEERPPADVKPLLAAAAPEAGEKVYQKCKACHVAEKGGPSRVGPHLWGVVGRAQASVPGFGYSDALKKHTGTWTYDELNMFLASPKTYAPGTKMTFAGLPEAKDRAAVIAYLRGQADSPAPLP